MNKFLSRLNSTSTWRILMWAHIALVVSNIVGMIVCFNICFVYSLLTAMAFAALSWFMVLTNKFVNELCTKNKSLAEIASRLLDELVKYKEYFGPLPEGEEKKEEQSKENEEVF